MHEATSARRVGRNWNALSGRRHAITCVAAALLMLLPFAANSQTGQGIAPAASPAPTASAPATGTRQVRRASRRKLLRAAYQGARARQRPLLPLHRPAAPASAALPGEHMISGADLPEDLSPWGMFENSDLVVKAVIIGLALASFVTWTVWVAKTLELRSARGEVRRDLRVLNNSVTLAQAHDQLREGNSPVSQLMRAAGQEIRLSANLRADGLKERIALQLERIEMAVSRKVSRGTGVLATIGSTAPFVGLFGTVWGIMNSFIGISNAHTTNLAVVAPGIAQALLATAFGLVAAIPAVMIYNVLARQTAHYRAYLGDASAQVMRLVSRDLDRAKLPMTQAAE